MSEEALPRTPNPELRDQFGEDPARFLGRDVSRDQGADVTFARIRGIVDPDLVRAYLEIEVNVFQRRPVIAALNRQLIFLRSRENPLVIPHEADADQDADDQDEAPIVYRHIAEECGSTDLERLSDMAFSCEGCGKLVPTSRVEEVVE